jgi:C1A family cysteine protease
MPRTVQRFGWIPDLPDQRDFLYAAPATTMRALPSRVDLRETCPPIYDQGDLGSCTANAIAAAIEFNQMKERVPHFTGSRLFIYYNERAMEGTIESDAGAMIRDGIKSVATQGVCPETMWPYNIDKFRQRPPDNCYAEALKHKIVLYQRLPQLLSEMQGCLASGFPFVLGFAVYESIRGTRVGRTGDIPIPGRGEHQIGGHAVLAVGYDDATRKFLIRNSWCTGWGQHGYGTLPYGYLVNPGLASDFWTIRRV